MSTTWTQADLTAIEQAIATGAMRVQYEDRAVTYRSLADMYRVRNDIRQCLSPSTAPKKPSRTVAGHSKGLGPAEGGRLTHGSSF